jgi:probable addiction module antidote protein
MIKNLSTLDISEYLDNDEIIAEYLSFVLEENNPALLLRSIGHIAKAKGMAKIAAESGLGRESLYKALNENAQPRFETIMKVLSAMNIKMNFAPAKVQRRKTAIKKKRIAAEQSL